jgi:hypothetical protein
MEHDMFAQNHARFRRDQEHIVRAKRNAQEQAQEQARQSRAGAANVSPEEWNANLQWARQHIGGSEAAIRAAAQAVMQVKAAGSSDPNAAIAAAREAARHAEATPQRPGAAPPGKIVGFARRVQPQRTEFRGVGGNFQVLDFELECPGQEIVRVQLRGFRIDGRVAENDEIVVTAPPGGSRFIQADRVFNRTTNAEARAGHGHFGSDKSVRRIVKVILGMWIAVMIVLIASFVGFSGCSANEDIHSPASWCEQAKKAGMENPPGC